MVLLASLKARVDDTNEIDLQLVDADGTAIAFKNLSIDINVTLRAKLKNAPEQPSERIGSFTRAIVFTNASTATLVIEPNDTTRFRSDDHNPKVEVILIAAAYPGLQGATATIDLSS